MNNREAEVSMSIWKHFRKVTPELLAQFFYENGVPTIICPICSGTDMSIPRASENIDGEEITYVHPSKVDTFGVEPQHSLLQYHYRLICKKCGYENRFSVHPVFYWMEKKEKVKETP
ncbi:hypothetical protein [Serratia proteamaculans]|uniref:Uncharacterized protein n=1 Tax=Serratia proteamaculans TaxID=28151 RepID=A0A5Q2VHD2_SERPR|nr:hypothetical protein [Serratia proteamaculans]QGH63399.1 hypothetical protein GHV41_22265 [Serratia proteamaculans]